MAEPDLLPCPFCGGAAELDRERGFRAIISGKPESGVAAYCSKCGTEHMLCRSDLPEYDTDQLVTLVTDAWNRREAPAPDQTNAEVSDERLRERADALWEQLLPHMQVAAHASGAHSAYDDKVAAIGFIMAELTRRSVTSQASEGEVVAWQGDAPDGRRGLTSNSKVAEMWKDVGRTVTPLYASPSKRVERLETADIERLARSAAVSAVDAIHGYTMEFAQSPANHRDEYDQAESAIRYELTRALGAPS